MKSINELLISPTPWKVSDTLRSYPIRTCDVTTSGYMVAGHVLEHDARLIAKAPEMYQLIYEAIPWLKDISAEVVGNKCAREIDDLVKRMQAALAKAAGEEAEK